MRLSPSTGRRSSAGPGLGLWAALAALAWSFHSPGLAAAGSYTLTLQPDASQTDDSYLREDNSDERNGSKSDLRLKASDNRSNRHPVVRIPLTGLAGRSVLRAWLGLTQSAGSNTPIDARVYPLRQSWTESEVTWDERADNQLWTRPGGTRDPFWSGRALVSSATVGSEITWEVGPILQAWQLGAFPNHGVIVEADRNPGGSREMVFRASEYGTAAARPKLVVQYTDEPPAVRSGWAETQPRAIQAGAVSARVTLWLDVDAVGTTPSGAATGFDAATIAHGGAFVTTAVDTFLVNGSPVATSLVTWTDNGSSVTFRFPRIRALAQVQMDFRVTVLAPASSTGRDLPVTVDDSATPGAWAQSLWPGNADRIAGNGDDWIVVVTSSAPVKIHVKPDTARVVERLCTQFYVLGEDVLGNQFSMNADSFRVVPPSAGTITRDGLFCALAAGTAQVIGFAGALRDTALAIVTPALTPDISAIDLRNRAGLPTNALSPADTMFLDVTLRDGDGFRDIRQLDFEWFRSGHQGAEGAPAFRSAFRWTRGASPDWTLLDPLGSTWRILPALCAIDTTTNATTSQTVRLAFVAGSIARASAGGEWSAAVRVVSATPPDTSAATRAGVDCQARLTMTSVDTSGTFNSGQPGATRLPLARPVDGRLEFRIETNAPWDLLARAADMAGTFSPSDTLFVRAPNQRLEWGLSSSGGGGYLDTALVALASNQPAPTAEGPIDRTLYLWVTHPTSLPAQEYRGDLHLRARTPDFAVAPRDALLLLTAHIVSGGLAAQSALAEVVPHQAPAGAIAQPFDAYLLPQFQGTDTGINRILAALPDGYGATAVTAVDVAGSPVPFTDASASGVAEVLLATRLTSSSLVRIRFATSVPTRLDTLGSSFVLFYDDAATALAPQTAVEGNANGVSDGNSWNVKVVPGPLASLEIAPETVTSYVGDSVPFAASGFDAYGHPVGPAVTWSAEGGVGSIGSGSGVFTASAPGQGLVIARSGSVADTAQVTVWRARAIAVRSVRGPASAYQGQSGVAVAVHVENLGGTPVVLDTLRLSFGRGSPVDADADFVVTHSPLPADTLPVAATLVLGFAVDVLPDALVGPLAVNARASGLEVGGNLRLTDPGADTTLSLTVVPGGIQVSADPGAGTVRPGQRAVLIGLKLRNLYPEPRTLARLSLANLTVGPGDPETLDDELGDVSLFLDDGDGTLDPARDTLLLETLALGGTVNFAPLAVTLGPGAERRLLAAARPPLRARDGDRLDLAVLSADDVSFTAGAVFRNAWPVDPPGSAAVDGMVADQVTTLAAGAATLNPGAADQLAFAVLLPANGYEPDLLRRLGVVNRGTATSAGDILAVRAWTDDGDGAFDAARDRRLGALTFTGDRWELTGLLETVPLEGLRCFLTVDATVLAAEGRTVRLALPAGPYPGVEMQSGNSGPLDRAVESPRVLTVSNLDRVALTAVPIGAGTARPGDRDRIALRLQVANNYADPRTLSALTISNRTAGPGTLADRDREIRIVTLREDGDQDGQVDDPLTDPVLGTGFFSAGRVTFAGLNLPVAGLSSRQLLATLDLSPTAAADGDVLAVAVEDPGHVAFVEPTTVTGLWPLDSGARHTIDGFVASQLAPGAVASQTLGPGDGPVLALDVVVPPNGYQTDVLRSVVLTNLGSARSSDLGEVKLWADGGDGVFTADGDDVPVATLTPDAALWRSPLLSTTIPLSGLRLFASVTISPAPAESATVRLAVPVMGIENGSGNDGPLDGLVASPDAHLLSTAPLLATLQVPPASTVGQPIAVRMRVRNVGGEAVTGVTPPALEVVGTAAFTPLGGPTPASLDLLPGETDTLVWTYSAATVGEARFAGSAAGTGSPSGLPRRAQQVSSGLHRVFGSAERLQLSPVHTMPVSVNPGQEDVVPFSLTLVNSGSLGTSDVRLRRLGIRLETEAGQPIVPADLLGRVTVNEGTITYLVKSSMETAGAEVDLRLATPVVVTGSEPTTLNLRLDLLSSTVVPSVRVVIADGTQFEAEDATSLAPVTVAMATGDFPLRSRAARIVAEATDADVSGRAPDTLRVARGASSAALLGARLQNRGVAGITADVRVSSFTIVVLDSAGTRIRPAERVGALRVVEGSRILASFAIGAADGPVLTVPLSPPLNLPAGSPVDLAVEGTIAAGAPLGGFRLALIDSSRMDAYDAVTRDAVAAHFAGDSIVGNEILVEANAETLGASFSSAMPTSIAIGQPGVTALRLTLRHPGGPGTARIRVDSVRVSARDELRRPLSLATHLARLSALAGAVPLAVSAPPPDAPAATLALSAAPIAPGDSLEVALVLDVNPGAPAATLELAVPAGGVHAVDVNRGSAVTVASTPGSDFPLVSGIGRLVSPPRRLVVGLTSRMPAALVADGRPVTAASLALTNDDPQGSGSVFLDWLEVRAAGEDFAPLPIGALAGRVEAHVGGAKWAESAPLAPDSASAWLPGSWRLEIPKGETVEVELRWIPQAPASVGRVRLGCDAPGVGVVQPASALLAVQVLPAGGQSFPLWSETGGLGGTGLAESYASFPNPFAAGREAATFAYYLSGPARVSLRILTPRGEAVATLLNDAPRAAGLQQTDRWDGRNGVGRVVFHGVYVAELVVRYDDGSLARVLRKVAVAR